ncbi:MAG: response regulator transcription factor [Prevotella sp.]|nr:response regulator transcription factor [Prevotella sp.]
MKQFRILIVDDEPDICEILTFNLETEGYIAENCLSAERAYDLITTHEQGYYDLLLLDVMLSGMSGFALARELKHLPRTSQLPIIFITAKDTENDLVTGLNLGADDYIAKPFSLREVFARIKAVLRRSRPAEEENGESVLRYEGLAVDTASKSVTADGRPVRLTKTEYDILALLLKEQRQVFSRAQIINRIWRDDVIVLERTVDVNITRLRKKISPYGANIKTRQGFGYCFEP